MARRFHGRHHAIGADRDDAVHGWQRHVDPRTGKETIVFSCFNQDQEMDRVDFPNLNARLRQNTVQEKVSNMWLDHLLETVELPHV